MILHCQALRNTSPDVLIDDSVNRMLQSPSPSLRLQILFDQYPGETTIALLRDGRALDTRGSFETPSVEVDVVFEELQFDVDYRLEVRDSLSDGICCRYGQGNFTGYAVYPNGFETMLFSNDGDFGVVAIHLFRIESPVDAPTAPLDSRASPLPPSPGFPACSVCGEGMRVSLPDVEVNIPTFGETRCGIFQRAGDLGFIEAQFCPLLPGFVAPCGCVASSVTPAPTLPAPEPAEPTAPVPPSPAFPACSVCGEGMRVSLPDVEVDIPTFGHTRCGIAQRAGDFGFIEAQFCPLLPPLVAPCGCVVSSVTPAPSLSVTPAPSLSTPTPVAPVPPSPGFPACSVCGEGRKISIPDALIEIEGQESFTCAVFAQAGELGFIDQQICPVAPQLAAPCGCVALDDGPACNDDPNASFVVDMVQGNRGCGFLQSNPSYQYLCEFLDVAVACKQTCQVCFMFQ